MPKINMLCLDTSLTKTGFAIFSIDVPSLAFKLLEFGVIDSSETEFGTETDSRARAVLIEIRNKIYFRDINCIVTEEPSGTIYGFQRMSKQGIVGRAYSVYKVFAATYAIIGYAFSTGIYTRVMQPSQWQKGQPKKSKLNSKVWSVREANKVLAYLKFDRRLTLKEDHTADAINIGIQAISNFHNKEWEIPSLTESE